MASKTLVDPVKILEISLQASYSAFSNQ